MVKSTLMEKQDIRDISHQELRDHLVGAGEKDFRASQIFDWIYQKKAESFTEMTNLPSALRESLAENFLFEKPLLLNEYTSRDGTVKFLFQMKDGERIETVVIPAKGRVTVCVSSQAGCKFACGFCASGIGGFKRNLTAGEIVNQILYAKNRYEAQKISHIVFMGIGEPLDNYENVLKAVRLINSPKGLRLAARHITISTCGLVPQIQQLAREKIQLELSVSLHGFSDESRKMLMPVGRKYPLKDLIKACRDYIAATKRQVTFEYILIQGLTCTEKAALDLSRLLKGMICKLNLIPYNKVSEFNLEPPTKMEVLLFRKRLAELRIHSTIRIPRGQEVNAACGQLRQVTS